MKLSLAQIRLGDNKNQNFNKTIDYIAKAGNKSDLLIFPELQLSPFYPLKHIEEWNATRDDLSITLDDHRVRKIQEAARESDIYVSPNIYIKEDGKNYDMSLMINPKGEIVGKSAMVNIHSSEKFWEGDYYDSWGEGYKVYHLQFGNVGVVVCYDRHKDGIEQCAQLGAQVVVIPTVNLISEPMDEYAQEMIDKAKANKVYIAMCNRVGREGDDTFAGESIVVSPEGEVLVKAGNHEELITVEINL